MRGQGFAPHVRSVLWALAVGLSSCATTDSPARALQFESGHCDAGTTAAQESRVLDGSAVLRVDPLYSYIHSVRTGTETRVSGVKLLVAPPQGMSASEMLRVLQCHAVRAALGRFDPSSLTDDPFALAGAWVGVGMSYEGVSLAVTVEASTVSGNLELLDRAHAYAAAHQRHD